MGFYSRVTPFFRRLRTFGFYLVSLDHKKVHGMSMKIQFLAALLALSTGCKPKVASSEASEQTLRSEYGRKKIYLWSKSIKSSSDKILRGCWYYKEAPPSLGLSDKEALIQSIRLNDFAIHNGHIQRQMENILKEKLINAGAEFVPCGLATVSVGAAIASGGASAIAFGVSSAWMANNCIKNSLNIAKYVRELRGSADGMASLENGETKLGQIFSASKTETDMFREAIRRARQLGLEDKVPCPRANQLSGEIRSY
ncbi:MAG: hypothetical protein RI932_409 [Pseudomonadota bacterium]